MCMMCLKYRMILLIVIKTPWVILLTSGLFLRWRHLYDNCRIKIACKHRNCGDMRNYFLFFVVKNEGQTQKASGPKVADWQYVGVDKFTR